MPGKKELEHFREELSKLGNEREVTEERGETYEPFPPPSASINTAPSIDVDNLLAGIGNSSESDTASAGDIVLPESGLPPESPDSNEIPPSPEETSPDLSEFDSLLDSLQLDGVDDEAPVADTSAETPGPDDFSLPDFSAFTQDESEPESTGTNDFSSVDINDFEPISEQGAEPAEAGEMEPAEAEEIEPVEADDLEPVDVNDFEPALAADEEPIDPVSGLDALLAAGLPELEDSADDDFSVPGTDAAEDSGFSLPDDFSLPSLDDSTFSPQESPSGELPPDNFDIPDFTDSGNFSEPVETGDDSEIPDLGDLSDLGGMGTADEIPDLGDIAGFGDTPSADIVIDQEPAFETMDLTPPSAESPGPGGMSPIEETSVPPSDFSDFSIPDDLPVPPGEEPPSGDESVIYGFDGFSLDEDILHAGGSSGEDEFHIPGFSDFAEGSGFDGLDELIPKETSRKSSKKDIPLEISEADFASFLDLLARYPLNLRMAIEEYLSEGDGSERNKMEVVHHVLEQTPLKKVARIMEDRLNRSIPIPKDFEKKTAAEYEQEKSSLRYVLFNKIIPAAILFTGISILTACVVFLSWQFIYRPIAAERLYKRGYAAIEDARYTRSMQLFDDAVVVWNKKKWYFRYARAYRDNKQFITAEIMYERLLNRFKNDRKAGLEYAEMLRSDLRNFEKAETILKRRVLDNYVNDPEGMMLLGDTYLDWGEEDPSKYDEARALYASLIELYGSKDAFLARMMRYFIRTDNLAEVLPLKDHFVSQRKMTLGSSDLVELSGYLLDKRYSPAPGDSEALRAQIDDVRDLLEKAVVAAPVIPEAHYNMGRFFIHNYRPEEASLALGESLRLFDSATSMSPKRVLTRIDAFRLLGELRVDDKEYLRAQELYAQGKALYEQNRENRAVRQDSRVGQLYADSADIDYFISNDLDAALVDYRKAVNELYDTPSVRYRIGYIHYQKRDFEKAMHELSRAYAEEPQDRNIRYSFANTLFRRGNFFASQGHFERLMESLEAERIRKGIVFPQTRSDHATFVELYMKTSNNLGVTLNRLAQRTGDSARNARALALLSESARAWDAMTRNPETMVRLSRVRLENDRSSGIQSGGSDFNGNLAYMNIKYMTHPRPEFLPELYSDIPKTLEGEAVLQQREDR